MAYVVMACVVMAYVAMAYAVMAFEVNVNIAMAADLVCLWAALRHLVVVAWAPSQASCLPPSRACRRLLLALQHTMTNVLS